MNRYIDNTDEEHIRSQIRLGIKNNYIKKNRTTIKNLEEVEIDSIVSRIRKEIGIQDSMPRSLMEPVLNESNNVSKDENLTTIYKIGKKINIRLKKIKFLQPILEKVKYMVGIKIKYSTAKELGTLLQGNDTVFIQNAYQQLLNRDVDQSGLENYIVRLSKTQGNRVLVLGNIRYSKEGKRNNVKVRGLRLKYYRIKFLTNIYKVPVLGYILQFLIGLCTLPRKFNCLYSGIYNNNKQLTEITGYILQTLDDKHRELLDLGETVKELSNIVNNENLAKKINSEVSSQLQGNMTKLNGQINKDIQNISEKISLISNKIENNMQVLNDRTSKDIKEMHEKIVSLNKDIYKVSEVLSENKNGKEIKDIYLEFENKFRGSREEIKDRLRFYLPYIEAIDIQNNHEETYIVDIGCGRGELLELLKQNRYRYVGVDNNKNMVEQCRELNLNVIQEDAITYLKSLENDSVNVITAIQVVEHIGIEQLITLFKECQRVLKKNGAIIFETPNPENLIVGACNFYFDPTHKNPIPPLQLQYIAEVTGYINVQILRQHPYNFINKDTLEKMPSEVKPIVQLFNQEADYAVIAYKK